MKFICFPKQVNILHTEVVEGMKFELIEKFCEITLDFNEVFGPVSIA